MKYVNKYSSPLGEMFLTADDDGLTGLFFEGEKYFDPHRTEGYRESSTRVLADAKRWLDTYFAGRNPGFELPVHFVGTDFQKSVWKLLYEIPYGETTTYGKIAAQLADMRGIPQMSAQAVGGAVGRNRISIIVPCHRVIGMNGSMTGYAGGIDKKVALLKLEGAWQDSFFVPRKSTAP